MVIGIAVCAAGQPGRAQLASGWTGADIGHPTAGTDTYANGLFTITGSGSSLHPEGDQVHFTSTSLGAGGNFRLTARVTSFDGKAGSAAGLMVRQGMGPTASMGAVAYQPAAGSGTSPNTFSVFARNTPPDGLYPWRNFSSNSAMAAPCWLQLIRYGNNFAVYKSTDGKDWAQVQSSSGGAFSAAGPIDVGLFVASGGTNSAKATFDNVKLEKNPALPYESSWIGNSFSSDAESYVSGGATALWVGPDGTCYCTSSWDEGGEPGKSYKDGKIVHPFTVSAGHCYEGSITSDGTHLYYFGSLSSQLNQIYQTSLAGSIAEGCRPMYLQTPLIDAKTGMNKMSGLAYGNGELYVSDQLTGQVLVVNPSQTTYGLAWYANNITSDQPIDTSGVTHPAPQEVYRSAFQCDAILLSIPGLTAGKNYNVRLNFAELNPADHAPGKRLMDISVAGKTIANYDIFAAAGALDKATTVSFDGVRSDRAGNLSITAIRSKGTVDGSATINGIEILNSDGTPFRQINCGGPAVGSWDTTIQEIPSRAFAFTRPGPIAIDKSGNLWIVQEGTNFPASGNFTSTAGWAAIKLYDKNGRFLNKQITDVVSPTALSYDAASDRLLVAENGPAQNIRFYKVYTGTDKVPACTSTFGISGGVFAGKNPGVIHDPQSGGDARFLGPTGVGLDAKGNIYVLCNPGSGANQTDLRAFQPDGTLLWSLFGLEMTHTGDFDPTAEKSDVWTVIHHYAMDYGDSKAGNEWKLKSYLTNPFAYQFPSNVGGGCAVYRRINGTPILYTAGQGVLGPIYIYRFAGEQIIPAGCFRATNDDGGMTEIWIDKNGDGLEQKDEVVRVSNTGMSGFDVDNNGDIYLAMGEIGNWPRPKVEKFPFQGFNSHGVPIYTETHTRYASPEAFNGVDTGNVIRLRYTGGSLDTMYLLGLTRPNANRTDDNSGGTLACYDHWNSAPVLRFLTVLPTPADNPNFEGGAPPYTGDGYHSEAFDVANGISFVTDLWGTIRVYDARGKWILNLLPGPEIGGLTAWEDEAMGLRAHYNASTGEYDVLQETSGFRAKQNFYRWKPKP